MANATDLRHTPLHAAAIRSGGRMVPFAGWEMAVQFAGLVQEHTAVREHCGVFDISHMGVLTLSGEGVKDALQHLVPSDLHRIGPGEACYTVLLNEAGGILDDLIIYDRGSTEAVVVINAACADNDTAWLRQHLEPKGITGLAYWEGACRVLDEQGAEIGAACLELTGYAGDLRRGLR